MGFMDRVSRVMAGSAVQPAAAGPLSRAYIECKRRAEQLLRHADMAPQAYSIEGLRALAEAEEAQAGRLREALHAHGASIPAVTPPVVSGAASHWGRLVQDLEAHRRSVQELRETAMHLAEDLPDLSRLFDQLCSEDMVHCERLRALIARADPQADD